MNKQYLFAWHLALRGAPSDDWDPLWAPAALSRPVPVAGCQRCAAAVDLPPVCLQNLHFRVPVTGLELNRQDSVKT